MGFSSGLQRRGFPVQQTLEGLAHPYGISGDAELHVDDIADGAIDSRLLGESLDERLDENWEIDADDNGLEVTLSAGFLEYPFSSMPILGASN